MASRILNGGDAGPPGSLAGRLYRAGATAVSPEAARLLREISGLATDLAGTARRKGLTGKARLFVEDAAGPYVISSKAIGTGTGLPRRPADGRELRFTVITSEDDGGTPLRFRLARPVPAGE